MIATTRCHSTILKSKILNRKSKIEMLSPDTENVLTYLDQVSGSGLRKRNDMGTLLELAAAGDLHQEMNDLVFHGRHLYNLYPTLRKTSGGAEGYQLLEREFSTAVETVRGVMA